MYRANILPPDTIGPVKLKAPLVMIIHGWLGSAESTYVVSAAHALHQAGFHVARLTLRDHGNTADLNQGLFHSAMTDEVVAAAQFVMNDFQRSEAGLLGFSMGRQFCAGTGRRITPASHLGHRSGHQPSAHRESNRRQRDL